MIAMIEISRDTARAIWESGGIEVFELLGDGAESAIEGGGSFDDLTVTVERFGIEGVSFGKPYGEVMPKEVM